MNNMRILLILKSIARILFVTLNNIYCIPTFCVWMLFFQPLRYYRPNLYWKIEGTFFHWLLAMVSMWSWSAGYDIVEIGDDIRLCVDDRTLVIANHQSTADVPMLMANFNAKPCVLPNIMWIMDRVFKFTNFGIVSIIHEDFFILSGKAARDEAVTLLKTHLKESYIPLNRKLMVLFPEGGFLRKRREASKRYALKNNLPMLNNVSLPRMGAMHGIMDVLGPQGDDKSQEVRQSKDTLRWVLDITIAYPEGKPLDLPTIVTGSRKPCQTFLFYRLFPSVELPKKQEEVTQWLFTRWEEKDKILEEFYKTGEVPVSKYCSSPLPPQKVQQDPLRFFLLHLFFIASSYLHFKMLLYIVSCIW
ncbi:acyl-CoA:lysophosphatidylglycerol acyltransferase 1-like [Cimex lectularius]|uniref:Phospholipid/glycerol acyltransferase domain-containing protein n=1 Tax=Cimex lectularius TaxID=79782 RepID=A0A8I6RB52_CIMLE|nr:acyl-CoA:lysophosphatidylglycerol acyltransferase 1-like [Cimex lectularius]XP_014242742.1 acyl-CoA:lysophosphatidylglycerol acyltransferase 1-like [Cimex lectularius]